MTKKNGKNHSKKNKAFGGVKQRVNYKRPAPPIPVAEQDSSDYPEEHEESVESEENNQLDEQIE